LAEAFRERKLIDHPRSMTVRVKSGFEKDERQALRRKLESPQTSLKRLSAGRS
jgi:hypothetical protein